MSFARSNSYPPASNWIDGGLYPEQEVPDKIELLTDKIDFIARLCAAWDFGILPLPETLKHISQPDWKEAVDETQMLTSCAYHLLREMHNLPPLPYLGTGFPEILNDPWLSKV